MRILLASSEVHPYSKTGGLADMVGALAKTLARTGHEVGLVTPLYAGVHESFPEMRPAGTGLELALGPRRVSGRVWSLDSSAGFTVYFLDVPEFYERAGLYQEHGVDYPDNAERFIFFSKAIAHLSLNLPWKPEVVHLHDWQTGFAPLFLCHSVNGAGQGTRPATCMTIHNLAYQGLFPSGQYPLTNLSWEYFTPAGVEFYGRMNCLKAGLAFADVLTTVSPQYAREITTPEFGCGLDGLLRQRKHLLTGILNGVDYDEWNTSSNHYIAQPYSKEQPGGKAVNKAKLQQETGLPVEPGTPIFGSIGRLVDQKGVDLMLGALEQMRSAQIQVVILGTGTPAFEKAVQELAARNPSQIFARIGFDEAFSHRIEAGSDFFMMPSRFEPCGLNQMYGLRYGTIPIVRATGGLEDTVIDVRENAEKANGIKFHDCTADALAKALRKALALYGEPELLRQFRLNAMEVDFSWEQTSARYLTIYNRARDS